MNHLCISGKFSAKLEQNKLFPLHYSEFLMIFIFSPLKYVWIFIIYRESDRNFMVTRSMQECRHGAHFLCKTASKL